MPSGPDQGSNYSRPVHDQPFRLQGPAELGQLPPSRRDKDFSLLFLKALLFFSISVRS